MRGHYNCSNSSGLHVRQLNKDTQSAECIVFLCAKSLAQIKIRKTILTSFGTKFLSRLRKVARHRRPKNSAVNPRDLAYTAPFLPQRPRRLCHGHAKKMTIHDINYGRRPSSSPRLTSAAYPLHHLGNPRLFCIHFSRHGFRPYLTIPFVGDPGDLYLFPTHLVARSLAPDSAGGIDLDARKIHGELR